MVIIFSWYGNQPTLSTGNENTTEGTQRTLSWSCLLLKN